MSLNLMHSAQLSLLPRVVALTANGLAGTGMGATIGTILEPPAMAQTAKAPLAMAVPVMAFWKFVNWYCFFIVQFTPQHQTP